MHANLPCKCRRSCSLPGLFRPFLPGRVLTSSFPFFSTTQPGVWGVCEDSHGSRLLIKQGSFQAWRKEGAFYPGCQNKRNSPGLRLETLVTRSGCTVEQCRGNFQKKRDAFQIRTLGALEWDAGGAREGMFSHLNKSKHFLILWIISSY